MHPGEPDPELENLLSFYPDIDPEVVAKVWEDCDKDYKASMEALAEIARNPSAAAAAAQSRMPTSPVQATSSDAPSRNGRLSLDREGSLEVGGSLFTAPTPPVDTATWEHTGELINQTLSQVGDSVVLAATSMTNWFADLATVFESGWDDEEEEGARTTAEHRGGGDQVSVVTAGGLDTGRLQQRRANNTSHSGGGHNGPPPPAPKHSDDDWIEDDEDFYVEDEDIKKDS